MKGNEKIQKMIAEHRELEKLIPLHPTKMRKRVAKSELWSRSEMEELSKLAEALSLILGLHQPADCLMMSAASSRGGFSF